MKKSFIPVMVSLMIMAACNNNSEKSAEENALLNRRDSIEMEMVNTLDEINKNLDMIRDRQGIIAQGGTETPSRKQEILHSISLINKLLEENQRKIEELTAQNKKLGREKSAMGRIAEQTSERIKKQEKQIEELKIQLAMEEFKVADLNVMMDELKFQNEKLELLNEDLSQANAEFDKNANRVYFTYGTYAQLKEKGILEKSGLLKTEKKLTEGFFSNKSYFSEFDLRNVTTIPIQGKDPSLLTPHASNSYSVSEGENGYSSLHITDPDQFWHASRFLVVVVK